MLRRFLEKRRRLPELLSADDFYAPINAFLDPRLAELGFIRPKQGIWVREDCSSGRPMFDLWHFKGKWSALLWGFALTYVPHFNNSFTKLIWHRTAKSARLDVFPFDDIERTEDLSRFSTRHDHEIAVERVLGAALDRGQDFFEGIHTTKDLLPLFERLKRDKKSKLGYWNYVSLPLAHAFTLRVNEHYAEGRLILDEYVQRMKISGRAVEDLLRRYEIATADSSLL